MPVVQLSESGVISSHGGFERPLGAILGRLRGILPGISAWRVGSEGEIGVSEGLQRSLAVF